MFELRQSYHLWPFLDLVVAKTDWTSTERLRLIASPPVLERRPVFSEWLGWNAENGQERKSSQNQSGGL